jgi:hypothetical protein
MPDFQVVVTSGAVLKPWSDPVGPAGQPSRIRPHAGQPQLYWRATVGVPLILQALSLDADTFPDDASLFGRTFVPIMAEGTGPPHFSNPTPGFSTIVRFDAISCGHYCLGIRRLLGGGAVLVHVDFGA